MLGFSISDTGTGEDLFTMEDNYLLQDGMLVSDIEENGQWYAYSSQEEKKLVLGTCEEGNIRSLDVNINAIEAISLAMQEQVVYLTYLDESVEVYDINTGEFVRRYDNLSGGVYDVEEFAQSDKTVLVAAGGAYLLNKDKEVIAYIQGYEGYNSTSDSFILSKFSTLYEVPCYDTQELISMVK